MSGNLLNVYKYIFMYFLRFDSPGTTGMYENGQIGGFATAEGGNAIARYGVGEAQRDGPFSLRGASAQVKLIMISHSISIISVTHS